MNKVIAYCTSSERNNYGNRACYVYGAVPERHPNSREAAIRISTEARIQKRLHSSYHL